MYKNFSFDKLNAQELKAVLNMITIWQNPMDGEAHFDMSDIEMMNGYITIHGYDANGNIISTPSIKTHFAK